MAKVQVFDPAMCCPTGVCGPEVDPALVRFAADLEWLKASGAEVDRFNLAQQPAAFVENEEVAAAMSARDDALPLVLVDGKIASQGRYPDRATLAAFAGLSVPKSIYTEAVRDTGSRIVTKQGPDACRTAAAEPLAVIGPSSAPKKCC
jgi:hypothetical protein